MQISRHFILSTVVLSLSGFSAQAASVTNTNTSSDITVIRASATGGVSIDQDKLDLSLCSSTVNADRTRDCSQAVQAMLKKAGDQNLPALASTFNLEPSSPPTPHGGSAGNECMMVTIQTVLKQSALNAESFKGIGFSVKTENMNFGSTPTFYGENGRFTPKADLHPVGQPVTLKDGSLANVYEFTASGLCQELNDDGSIFEIGATVFKPYAQFQVGDDVTNNWDAAKDDYRISGVAAGSFDRRSDILASVSIPAPTVYVTNMLCTDAKGTPDGGAWLRITQDGQYNLNGAIVQNSSKDASSLTLSGLSAAANAPMSLNLNLTTHVGNFDIAALGNMPGLHLAITQCEIIK